MSDGKINTIGIGTILAIIGAGVSLGQQQKETELSSQRIDEFKIDVRGELARMQLELSAGKGDREMLGRIDERLKSIESMLQNAPTRKGRQK